MGAGKYLAKFLHCARLHVGNAQCHVVAPQWPHCRRHVHVADAVRVAESP
jgi:hypothetical protein